MMCKVFIFGCIAAVILMTAAYGAPLKPTLSPIEKVEQLKAAVSDLKQLENYENNFLELHTPNDKQECKKVILQFYLKELKVLSDVLERDDLIHLQNIQKNLSDLTDSDSSELTYENCASDEKKMFPEFRQELISFLQSMLREIM